MMDFKSYITETKTVEISVAKIGQQRITKSILNQMPEGFRINTDFDLGNIKILGYVKDKEEWVIYVEDNIAYKNNLSQIIYLLDLLASKTTVEIISNYIEVANWDEYSRSNGLSALPKHEQEAFMKVRDRAARFYNMMRSHQIYI